MQSRATTPGRPSPSAAVIPTATKIQNDFAKFSKRSDIIIANRLEGELKKVSDKVHTRNLFALMLKCYTDRIW